MSPREYCDEIVPKFHQLWKDIEIQDYRFERTSDEKHHRLVRTFWRRIHANGDVYKDTYAGWYHTSDNRFLDDDEVPDNPAENPRLKWLEEEAYFFRLSRYEAWLREFHEANPQFVVPDFRRNEMLRRIEGGLKDICISRTSTDWGIPLPWDEGHVCWVWIEALLLYMTGSGFDIEAFERTFDENGRSSETREPLWETTRADLKSQPETNFWPCDLHEMAKDIPWFHAVIWPAMLKSYGAPIPRQELIHGYWNFEGEKMSKSLGNVVDPYDAIRLVGVDGLRYFLMREVPVGLDGSFNYEALINRYNFDLANDLGNLVHRTVSMLHQLFDGKVPDLLAVTDLDDEIEQTRQETIREVLEFYPQLRYSEALQKIWLLIGEANKYIDTKKPWELKKKSERRDEVSTVFNRLIEVIRTVLVLASPVVPGAARRFWAILNLPGELGRQGLELLNTPLSQDHQTNPSEPVFQRIDLTALETAADSRQRQEKAPSPEKKREGEEMEGVIEFDDFVKVELVTAVVKSAEKVEKTDKLLRLELDDGRGGRQIVAGIAQHFSPEEMVGKQIIIVANLKPRKLRGLTSEGMLLAATDDAGNLSLATVGREMPPGTRLS
jgi:methionyl-tRNA synthetase